MLCRLLKTKWNYFLDIVLYRTTALWGTWFCLISSKTTKMLKFLVQLPLQCLTNFLYFPRKQLLSSRGTKSLVLIFVDKFWIFVLLQLSKQILCCYRTLPIKRSQPVWDLNLLIFSVKTTWGDPQFYICIGGPGICEKIGTTQSYISGCVFSIYSVLRELIRDQVRTSWW